MSELAPRHQNTLAVPLLNPGEQLRGPEFAGLRTWLKEQIRTLPEMSVAKSPLSNKETWRTRMAPDGKTVDSVSSAFFSIEGIDVATDKLSWHQGAIIQRNDFLPTKSGEKTEVSGVVILLTNPKGETFVTVSQEPLAPTQYRATDGSLSARDTAGRTEIHPVIRSGIQTSVQKLQLLSRSEQLGDVYDRKLTGILKAIAQNRNATITDVLNGTVFSKAPTDGNRISGNVVYGTIPVSEELARTISAVVPEGRWCPEHELDALILSGLTNGHLNIGRSVAEAQKRRIR